jgi:hypothetical protein
MSPHTLAAIIKSASSDITIEIEAFFDSIGQKAKNSE